MKGLLAFIFILFFNGHCNAQSFIQGDLILNVNIATPTYLKALQKRSSREKPLKTTLTVKSCYFLLKALIP